jgi:hypothetical protein
MKSVTLNIQFKDLSESKQEELQEMLEALCESSNLEPDDYDFELYVDVTFYSDGSQYVR